MKFRVIENSPPSHLDKYEEFIKLYNDGQIKVEAIRRELGWSVNVYERARRQALSEGRIANRHSGGNIKKKPEKSPPKYYSYNRNAQKFVVKKWVRDDATGVRREYYYGAYKDEGAVQRVVEELKKVGWDINRLEDIKSKLRSELGRNEL